MKELSKLEGVLRGCSSLYLVDLSWILHRNYNVFSNFGVNVDGYLQVTGHIYGTVKNIQSIIQDDPAACIIICQDGTPVERNAIMNDSGLGYKEGRPERQYDFYKDTNKIKAILCSIPNVYWAFNEDKESDDQMYALAKQAESLFDGSIFIYSGDNDLLQAIDDRVSIVRSHEKGQFKVITNYELQNDEKFTKKFHGVGSDHIVDFRVIVGDPSDHIPGIPRFPRDVAVRIATEPDFKDKCKTEKELKWFKIYEESQDIIKRNYSLMKLRSDYEVNLTKPVVKKEALVELLNRLQLGSCIRWMTEKGYL